MRIFIQLPFAALLLGLCTSGCKKDTTPAATDTTPVPVINTTAAMPATPNAKKGAEATVAASVDGATLSREELMQQVQSILSAQHVPEAQMPMAMQYFAPRIVNAFVTKTLLLAEVKRLKIATDEADRKKFMKPIEEMAAKQGMTVDDMIKQAPMGEKKAREELDEQILIEKLVDAQVRSKIKMEDKDVDAAFAKASKERADKRAQIETIRTQLLAGTNFEAVARERSDCPSGKQAGGDLGTFERGQMVKPFSDAAFTQKIGEIGQIIETDFGFHVIKVTAHNDPKPAAGDKPATPETVQASHILLKAPPAASREEARKTQEDKELGKAMQAYLKDLRGKAKIVTMFDKPAGGKPGMPAGMPEEMPEEMPE